MAMVSARQAAVTRNDAVTFCAGNPDDGCDGDWSAHQWIVFVDSDRDGGIDADDELKLFERFSASTVIDVSGNGPFRKWIVYMPSGMARWPSGAFAAGRLRVCTEDVLTPNATDLVLIGSGRVVTEQHDFDGRSEEHTSEIQSLMRISYAVFCLKKKKHEHTYNKQRTY